MPHQTHTPPNNLQQNPINGVLPHYNQHHQHQHQSHPHSNSHGHAHPQQFQNEHYPYNSGSGHPPPRMHNLQSNAYYPTSMGHGGSYQYPYGGEDHSSHPYYNNVNSQQQQHHHPQQQQQQQQYPHQHAGIKEEGEKLKKQQSASSLSSSSKSNNKPHPSDEEAAATALLMSAGKSISAVRGNQTSKSRSEVAVASKSAACQVSPGSTSTDSRVEVVDASLSTGTNTTANANTGATGVEGTSTSRNRTGQLDSPDGNDSISDEIKRKAASPSPLPSSMVENFPMLLHNLLCGRQLMDIQREMNINVVDVVRWMPCGKSWIVRDWNTFTRMLSRYFVPLQGKESFLREIQAWGFEEKCARDGSVSFHHEFFIEIAPNLCKYMTARKEGASSSDSDDQIASPPRLGRLGSALNSFLSGGKRKEPEGSNMNGGVPSNDSSAAPVTPSFTLASQVSPNASSTSTQALTPQAAYIISNNPDKESSHENFPFPRLRLQSNRGGRVASSRGRVGMMMERPSRPMSPPHIPTHDKSHTPAATRSYPVSKRGRRSINVSTRGGRGKSTGINCIPRQLSIPMNYDTISSTSRAISPRPN